MSIGAAWPFLLAPSTMGDPSGEVIDAIGTTVTFADGVSALCGTSGLWNVNFGYGNERVAAAVARVLRRGHYHSLFRYSHRPARETAERLLAIPALANYRSILFGTSGSATLDMVMKLVRQWAVLGEEPERRLVVSLRDSYHGMTYGALALSGEDLGQALYGADTRGVRHVAAASSEELVNLTRLAGTRIAAIVLEPVAGSGAIPLTPELLTAAVQLRRQTGALLVADEVATGFHRTGPLVASARWPEQPDVLVLSKGLTNGTCAASVAAVGNRVTERFEQADAVFAHGETQAGCPVSCAAIAGTLDFVDADLDVNHVQRLSARLEARLAGLAAEHGLRTSGAGLFRALRRSAGADPDPGFSARLIAAARTAGAVLHPCPDGVQLMPQLITTEPQLERIVAALADALRQTTASSTATELATG
jgi:hypothetical protein